MCSPSGSPSSFRRSLWTLFTMPIVYKSHSSAPHQLPFVVKRTKKWNLFNCVTLVARVSIPILFITFDNIIKLLNVSGSGARPKTRRRQYTNTNTPSATSQALALSCIFLILRKYFGAFFLFYFIFFCSFIFFALIYPESIRLFVPKEIWLLSFSAHSTILRGMALLWLRRRQECSARFGDAGVGIGACGQKIILVIKIILKIKRLVCCSDGWRGRCSAVIGRRCLLMLLLLLLFFHSSWARARAHAYNFISFWNSFQLQRARDAANGAHLMLVMILYEYIIIMRMTENGYERWVRWREWAIEGEMKPESIYNEPVMGEPEAERIK